MKLAAVVKNRFGSKLKPDYDSTFLVPIGPEEDTNKRACDLMCCYRYQLRTSNEVT
jgi:hypothetical protein